MFKNLLAITQNRKKITEIYTTNSHKVSYEWDVDETGSSELSYTVDNTVKRMISEATKIKTQQGNTIRFQWKQDSAGTSQLYIVIDGVVERKVTTA